jgi:hypothetical protein
MACSARHSKAREERSKVVTPVEVIAVDPGRGVGQPQVRQKVPSGRFLPRSRPGICNCGWMRGVSRYLCGEASHKPTPGQLPGLDTRPFAAKESKALPRCLANSVLPAIGEITNTITSASAFLNDWSAGSTHEGNDANQCTRQERENTFSAAA